MDFKRHAPELLVLHVQLPQLLAEAMQEQLLFPLLLLVLQAAKALPCLLSSGSKRKRKVKAIKSNLRNIFYNIFYNDDYNHYNDDDDFSSACRSLSSSASISSASACLRRRCRTVASSCSWCATAAASCATCASR